MADQVTANSRKNNPLQRKIQNDAFMIVGLQLLGVIGLSVIALIFCGTHCAFSLLAGGLAYVLPNIIFVWRVFRYVGAKQMTRFLTAFLFGEALKLIFSAFLFLIIEKYLSVSLLSELVGFVGAIVSFWVACMWFFSRQRISKGVV